MKLHYTNARLVPKVKWVLSILIVCLVTACGFHLRGDYQLSPQMSNTFIKMSNQNSELFRSLKRTLQASDINVVETPQQAQAVLSIVDEKQEKRVLSVDSQGRAREYEINYQIRFSVTLADDAVLVDEQLIQLQRDFLFDTEDVLGKSREQDTLIKDMQHDMVRLIMLRLQAVEKNEKDIGRQNIQQ